MLNAEVNAEEVAIFDISFKHSTVQHSLQHSAFSTQHFANAYRHRRAAGRPCAAVGSPTRRCRGSRRSAHAGRRPQPDIAADAWLVATTTRDDIDVDVDLGLDRHEALTARELEVLELLAQGLANKSIALRLGISDQTVKFHVASICGKLGASIEPTPRGGRCGEE